MRYWLVKETEANAPIVQLSEVKAHLRVDTNADDSLITSYIEAATAALDGINGALRRSIKVKTYLAMFEEYPERAVTQIRLPLPPLNLVQQVFVQRTTGPYYIPAADWAYVGGDESVVYPVSDWPVVEGEFAKMPFRIRYDVGYTASQLPHLIKQAILIHVGHMYANREAVVTGAIATQLPLAYQEIVDTMRVLTV
jgi:uncharacterized phiE125 gp8 family phage protein